MGDAESERGFLIVTGCHRHVNFIPDIVQYMYSKVDARKYVHGQPPLVNIEKQALQQDFEGRPGSQLGIATLLHEEPERFARIWIYGLFMDCLWIGLI